VRIVRRDRDKVQGDLPQLRDDPEKLRRSITGDARSEIQNRVVHEISLFFSHYCRDRAATRVHFLFAPVERDTVRPEAATRLDAEEIA
jgi:hypothetical protein